MIDKDYLQIRKRIEADCDGGDTYYVVVDTANNDAEISEWFKTEEEAEEFYNNFSSEDY